MLIVNAQVKYYSKLVNRKNKINRKLLNFGLTYLSDLEGGFFIKGSQTCYKTFFCKLKVKFRLAVVQICYIYI